jgi:YVTN family beta-propeller protein
MNNIFNCTVLAVLILMIGCKPDPDPIPQGAYEFGIFVVNEGVYGQSSGTITYYNPDSARLVQDIFKLANGRDLGNVVQSMYFYAEKVFVVVNNSNKIEVAKANDFKEIAQISGLQQPRYFLPISADKALVSQWGADLISGSIAVVDLNTNTVVQTISSQIGKGPENMLLQNSKVYVANVGGLEFDNFISVIDVNNLQVIDTIVTDDAPNSLQIGNSGTLWVACRGKTVYANYPEIDTMASTYGALLEIDLNNGNIINRIQLQRGRGASNLAKGVNSNELYFLYDNAICRLNTATGQWQYLVRGSFYGLGAKQGENYIYACSNSGIQAAWVYRFNAADGVKVDSFKAGVFANSIYFR